MGGDLSYVEFSRGSKESFSVGDCIYISPLSFDASGKEIMRRLISVGTHLRRQILYATIFH